MSARSEARGLALNDAIAAAQQLRPTVVLEQRRAEWRKAAEEIAEAAGTTLQALRRHPDHDAAKTEIRVLVVHYLRGEQASLPEIGRLLGYRDHTTVLYLLRRQPRRAVDVELAS